MRKFNKSVIFIIAMAVLLSPCAFAKKSKYQPPAFLKLLMQKSENPELQEKLSRIKEMRPNPENSNQNEEFKKYDLENEERNISESILTWAAIILFCAIIVKIICGNFKIPFDYDPNFKNKYVPHGKTKNKKYNFQKR